MPKINYIPINYELWDFSGQGKNIFKFLSLIEKKIWDRALPFQDSREGETGHAEFVTYFAFKLNDFLGGDREITIPSAILHDIGWSQLTESERNLFYEGEIDITSGLQIYQRYEPVLRARHQEQGVGLAERVLQEANYNSKYTKQVLEILSQHDTRKGFLNNNDGIMRDADKLWRYTLPCLNLWIEKRKKSLTETYNFLTDEMKNEGFFYSEISKMIANMELKNILKRVSSFK